MRDLLFGNTGHSEHVIEFHFDLFHLANVVHDQLTLLVGDKRKL